MSTVRYALITSPSHIASMTFDLICKDNKMADEAARAGVNGPEQNTDNLRRLDFKKQSLDDAYAAPANLLEIEMTNPETHGFARNRYTDYEVKMRVGW